MSELVQQTREQQQRNQQGGDRAVELVAKIQSQRTEIAKALGDAIGPERFLRAAATLVKTTPHLDECTTDSVLGALYVAAQMGLEVGGPKQLVYLVPYKNRKKGGVYEAQLIIGYRGWAELFYRAGAKAVQWFLIREGDQFRIGSDARIGKTYEWVQADPNSTARVTGVVAQVVMPNGGVVWEYLSRAAIEKRATDSNFWRDWWDEMALKTGLRRLAATAPSSTQLVLAQSVDETVQYRVEGGETRTAARPPAELARPVPTPSNAPKTRAPAPAPRADQRRSASVESADDDGMTDEERADYEAYMDEQDRLAEAASAGFVD